MASRWTCSATPGQRAGHRPSAELDLPLPQAGPAQSRRVRRRGSGGGRAGGRLWAPSTWLLARQGTAGLSARGGRRGAANAAAPRGRGQGEDYAGGALRQPGALRGRRCVARQRGPERAHHGGGAAVFRSRSGNGTPSRTAGSRPPTASPCCCGSTSSTGPMFPRWIISSGGRPWSNWATRRGNYERFRREAIAQVWRSPLLVR